MKRFAEFSWWLFGTDGGLRAMNRVFIGLLGLNGLAALIGVLFYGATHHLLTVGVCGVVIWVLSAENKRLKK